MSALLEQVKNAGIVGCGGAGFPTHIKWNVSNVEHFVINAVECEPLLHTDKYLIRHFAGDIVAACEKVAEHLNAKETIIVIKKNYTAEVKALEQAIDETNSTVTLCKVKSFYPAGDEHVAVYEATGKQVPYGGIPIDVGAVVSNVATMYETYRALENIPFIRKHLTVAGEVNRPSIIEVPIGTSIEECLTLAGGVTTTDCFILSGGPMMGKVIPFEEIKNQSVTKTTSGLLVFKKNTYLDKYKSELDLRQLQKRAATSCIQCSFCTMMCPRHLLGHPLEPHRIMRTLGYNNSVADLVENSEVVKMAALCSLCGVCTTYACPMGLAPNKVNQLLKTELAMRGIRSDKGQCREIEEVRDFRKIPTSRLISRLAIAKYDGKVKDTCLTLTPSKVRIAFSHGAGAPSEPVVQLGDTVLQGDLIAKIPDGKLGANIHASISGKITELSNAITIIGG